LTLQILGFIVFVIGVWANVNGKNYVDITDNNLLITPVSSLIIVVSLFVLIIGIVGTVGAIFATTTWGRITIGVVSIIYGM